MILSGCGTALITPFRLDGTVDDAAFAAHVKAQIDSGITLLVPCGTTGEASTLTETEWLHVIELTCNLSAGRVPVFAGCTHNSTAVAIKRIQLLSQIAGLTGILTANPYYNRPGQEGQYQHFRAIAEATWLPIMLYNIPGRTGANLEPQTVVRLAGLPNIVGIKESSGNLIQITELLRTVPPHFRVFAGDDSLALPILALGGAGLISVASNVIPEQISKMVLAALGNDWPAARELNRRFFPLMQALFFEPSPAPVKAVLNFLGHCHSTVRLPMTPVSEETRNHLESLCREQDLKSLPAER